MKTALSRISLLFIVIIAASMSAAAQDKIARIAEVVDLSNKHTGFSGAVLVAENGHIVYKKGVGLADREWNIPNDVDTKFRIGSVTKQFTAVLILQLVEQGKLKLDGKITDYLPDYRKDTGDRVTIHQLLNHTSGIPSYTDAPEFFAKTSRNAMKVDEVVKQLASGDLEFEPGTKFRYNNSAYFLLGAIIEKVTGKPYEQVLKEQILVPAGMTNSGYDNSSTLIAKRAGGYQRSPNGFVNAPFLDMSLPYAAGSLYSTVEDLFLWDQALYGDKLLSPAMKELMAKPGLSEYGYGVFSNQLTLSDGTKVPVVQHSGGINGFNSNLVRFVRDKHTIVILDNVGLGDRHGAIITSVANILYGRAYELPKRSIAETLGTIIAKEGMDAAIKKYREIKSSGTKDYDLGEAELNTLGYQLLQRGKSKEAGEVFKLNVEMFPNAANPHDSLGEYYAMGGEKELAIQSYRKALSIDPKFPSAIAALKRLEGASVEVGDDRLRTYVGKYQLAPNFMIEITLADGKLMGQATGQPMFSLDPLSNTRFAIRVVNAEIEFSTNASGEVTSLTLFQGGREMKGDRMP